MKSAGKARNNGLYRHIRTSKEIIRNLLNDCINCKRYKLSEQEIQMWSRDWKDNRERLKMLRKRGKQEVKMKGYCLLFYR